MAFASRPVKSLSIRIFTIHRLVQGLPVDTRWTHKLFRVLFSRAAGRAPSSLSEPAIRASAAHLDDCASRLVFAAQPGSLLIQVDLVPRWPDDEECTWAHRPAQRLESLPCTDNVFR